MHPSTISICFATVSQTSHVSCGFMCAETSMIRVTRKRSCHRCHRRWIERGGGTRMNRRRHRGRRTRDDVGHVGYACTQPRESLFVGRRQPTPYDDLPGIKQSGLLSASCMHPTMNIEAPLPFSFPKRQDKFISCLGDPDAVRSQYCGARVGSVGGHGILSRLHTE